MLGEQKFIVIGAAVAALAVLYLVKKNGAAAAVGAGLGNAAVEVVGGAVGGAAEAIGDAFGIPRTNETECQKAMREGRYLDASFACPAGTFIGGSLNDLGETIGGAIFDWTH